MNDGSLQLTMRELHLLVFSSRFWAAITGVGLLLGLTGPFGTFEQMPFGARFAYWLAVSLATWFAGRVTTELLVRWLDSRWTLPAPPAYAICGALGGVPVWLAVLAINHIAFGPGSGIDIGLVELLLYCVAISATVSALFGMFSAGERGTQPPCPPRLLDRLPRGHRGALSHMTMQDHYVDIRTDRGGALVLMRFADAIAETEGVEGLRIHRSHWVARDAVERAVRKDGRLFLKMRDGALLPVSRSYLSAVREAGLG